MTNLINHFSIAQDKTRLSDCESNFCSSQQLLLKMLLAFNAV